MTGIGLASAAVESSWVDDSRGEDPSEHTLAAVAACISSDARLRWRRTVRHSPSSTLVGCATLHAGGAPQRVAVKLFGARAAPMFGAREIELHTTLAGAAVPGVPLLHFGGRVADVDARWSGLVLVTEWVGASAPGAVSPGGLLAAESGSGEDADTDLDRLRSMVAALPVMARAPVVLQERLVSLGRPDVARSGALRRLRSLSSMLREVAGGPGVTALARRIERCSAALADPPATRSTTVCHGDYRPGNVVIDGNGAMTMVDWEMWHVGDPRLDLGYLLGGVEHRLLVDDQGVTAPDRVDARTHDLLGALPVGDGLDEQWEWFAAMGLAARLWGVAATLERHRRGVDEQVRVVLLEQVQRLRVCPVAEVHAVMETAASGAAAYGYAYEQLGVGDRPADLPDPGPAHSSRRHRFCDRLDSSVRRLGPPPPLGASDPTMAELRSMVDHMARRLRTAGHRI